jgi:hypothetical protein
VEQEITKGEKFIITGYSLLAKVPKELYKSISKVTQSIISYGNWINKKVRFPDVVYNASNPPTKKGLQIVEKLSRKIPFTSQSVGDKLFVYKALTKAKTFSNHLPPTKVIQRTNTVFDFLTKYKRVVIKPTNKNQGRGVIYIEQKTPDRYLALEVTKETMFEQTEFTTFITNKLREQEYIIQPFIESKLKNGLL